MAEPVSPPTLTLPVTLGPHRYLGLSVFVFVSMLVGWQWHLMVVSVTNDVEAVLIYRSYILFGEVFI